MQILFLAISIVHDPNGLNDMILTGMISTAIIRLLRIESVGGCV